MQSKNASRVSAWESFHSIRKGRTDVRDHSRASRRNRGETRSHWSIGMGRFASPDRVIPKLFGRKSRVGSGAEANSAKPWGRIAAFFLVGLPRRSHSKITHNNPKLPDFKLITPSKPKFSRLPNLNHGRRSCCGRRPVAAWFGFAGGMPFAKQGTCWSIALRQKGGCDVNSGRNFRFGRDLDRF